MNFYLNVSLRLNLDIYTSELFLKKNIINHDFDLNFCDLYLSRLGLRTLKHEIKSVEKYMNCHELSGVKVNTSA
ncbi:hypothetical protein BpHYR1_001851 [Brachionus plicatilis]|uniref:Uncharacterized protein n=1 Tax=Brachionus plicatilis TaxID=10195 RepID=A0A3M7PYS7_BRAPC|nr:hypothetical protein BpHYR1_001851 [Brachionus plicatilis]